MTTPLQFKQNDRVALRQKEGTIGGTLQRGTVIGQAKQVTSGLGVGLDTYVVEWDNGHVQKVTARSLMSESEAEVEEQRLNEEATKLEQEYEKARSRIAAKIDEAAQALREATKIAEASGSELQDFYDEVRPLMRAMDAAGWSTSSLSC